MVVRKATLFETAVFVEALERSKCLLQHNKPTFWIRELGGVLDRIKNMEEELHMSFSEARAVALEAAKQSDIGNYSRAIELLDETFRAVFRRLEPLGEPLTQASEYSSTECPKSPSGQHDYKHGICIWCSAKA